jgi:hypothetical protein
MSIAYIPRPRLRAVQPAATNPDPSKCRKEDYWCFAGLGAADSPVCEGNTARTAAAIIGALAGGYLGGFAGVLLGKPLVGGLAGTAAGAATGWLLVSKSCQASTDASPAAGPAVPPAAPALTPACPIGMAWDNSTGKCRVFKV